jgi:hypothetical protein
VAKARVRQRFGAVGFQDQIAKLAFLFRQRLGFLFGRQARADIEICLTFVGAEIQDFKGAERFAFGFQFALHLDEPFACGVDAELAEVCGDLFAPELFGHGGGRAAAAEKIRHQIAFVAAGFDNSFQN